MNLYDINKQCMEKVTPLKDEQLQLGIDLINQFHNDINVKYYMLLARDINYYTLFIKDVNNEEDIGSIVIDCIKNAGNGDILSIDLSEDKTAVEIWFKGFTSIEASPMCAYLFNYSPGVVFFGGN